MAKTAAEQAEELKLETAKMENERARIGLETDQLNLEEARESVAQRKAQKRQRIRLTEQTQEQCEIHRVKLEKIAGYCRHRQGGEGGNPYKGKGPTALKVEKMPDGFTLCVRCLVCPLQLFSPFPPDRSETIRKGETAQERDARVGKYHKDFAKFGKYLEKAEEDALSADAAQSMDAGVKFTVRDQDGNIVQKRRPSDSYATTMRNVIAIGG